MNEGSVPVHARKLTPAKGFVAVFLAVFLVVFIAGALITFILPEAYLSVARVRISNPAQIEVFTSRPNLETVAQQLDLNRTYAVQYGEDQPLGIERTLSLLSRAVQVRRVHDGDLAEIRVYSLSPKEAAKLANAIAEAGVSNSAASTTAPAAAPVIIDRAVPALKPARPNKPLNLTLAALVGAVLGVMAGGVGARLGVIASRHQPEAETRP